MAKEKLHRLTPEDIEMLKAQNIKPVDINKEMKKSFTDYAMSVIVGRALPDVRDGLKPVHRRILYAMHEDGLTFDKAFRKSATTVGNVLGRYHPHGDASVYDALVRMGQSFSLRYPMIDGHGNFGNIDGDPPAAYRYTEARMSRLAAEMMRDIDKETVQYSPNFDESREEPSVLPSLFPSLLVNGSMGIAVGMATNIPPHNLTETINATLCLIDNPEAELPDLMEHIQGPDFPTSGIILGRSGIRAAYATGKGRVVMRARCEIEEQSGDKFRISVYEIPYLVNKSRLVESIADLVKDKRVEGIADLRDVSGKSGLHIVIDLKKDANPQVVLNQLYKYSQLQDSFSVNMLAIVDGKPQTLTLKDALSEYISHRRICTENRIRYELRKAQERIHLLEGLKIAIDNIDEIIAIIRSAYNDAKAQLMDRFSLSDIQAQAILEMQLRRLQGLEREKLEEELAALAANIEDYKDILGNVARQYQIIKEELIAVRDKYGDERRTQIENVYDEIDIEDLIDEEECVITMSHAGYIKRMPVDTYRAQRRGGRGITGMTTREEDFVEELFVASTHSYIMFFTDRGKVYRLKGYQIPEAGRTAKGSNIINILPIEQGESISAVIHFREIEEEKYLTMITKLGTIKRTRLSEYATARKGGLKAIVLDEDDTLVRVKLTDGTNSLIVGTYHGKAIHFDENDVRCMGRVTRGVRGIMLGKGDFVVGMSTSREDGNLLTITENGYGKRTSISEYKIQNRGGKGITNYNLSAKTGNVAGIKVVSDDDDIILISDGGIIIRFSASEIPTYGRVTGGVIVMRLSEGTKVVTLGRTAKDEFEDIEEDIEGGENAGAEEGGVTAAEETAAEETTEQGEDKESGNN